MGAVWHARLETQCRYIPSQWRSRRARSFDSRTIVVVWVQSRSSIRMCKFMLWRSVGNFVYHLSFKLLSSRATVIKNWYSLPQLLQCSHSWASNNTLHCQFILPLHTAESISNVLNQKMRGSWVRIPLSSIWTTSFDGSGYTVHKLNCLSESFTGAVM